MASDQVRFVGPIYEQRVLRALRFHARLYAHGHTVGGTNPSLVEALGAGSVALAHENEFNRGAAGPRAGYFADERDAARSAARRRQKPAPHAEREPGAFCDEFTWDRILAAYERLLDEWWS